MKSNIKRVVPLNINLIILKEPQIYVDDLYIEMMDSNL